MVKGKLRNKKINNIYNGLNDRIDKFINWYKKELCYQIDGEKDLKKFIEKMAIWYELRYPSKALNEYLLNKTQKSVDEEMFLNNKYINVKGYKNELEFEWDKFYNYETFLKTLSLDERSFLSNPSYDDLVYIDPNKSWHFHLNYEGFIEVSEYIISGIDFTGMHIKDAVKILKKHNRLSKNNEIETKILNYEKRKKFKDELLNCVMYKIIQNGGKRIGPKRAFIFAKEFNRNIDIPMIYGIDQSDPDLYYFILQYLKAGGNLNLNCIDYNSNNMINLKEFVKRALEYNMVLSDLNIPRELNMLSFRYDINNEEADIKQLIKIMRE